MAFGARPGDLAVGAAAVAGGRAPGRCEELVVGGELSCRVKGIRRTWKGKGQLCVVFSIFWAGGVFSWGRNLPGLFFVCFLSFYGLGRQRSLLHGFFLVSLFREVKMCERSGFECIGHRTSPKEKHAFDALIFCFATGWTEDPDPPIADECRFAWGLPVNSLRRFRQLTSWANPFETCPDCLGALAWRGATGPLAC